MPLGYENNGVSAGLIERGGDLLAQSLIDTGKTIEGALIRSQAFKQARELGAAIQQTNPQSDDWPQQAAFLVSQYPLAAQSGLAKMVMEPVGKAYAGYQAAKRVDNVFGNNVALENLRSRHAMDRVEARPGATGAMPLNFNSDPLSGDIQPGQQQGIQGVLQDTFSTMKGDQPAQDASVLPPLGAIPDAATAMQQRSQRELMVMKALSDENKASMAAGGPALWTNRNSQMEANRRLKEEEKANVKGVDLVPSQTVPGVMVNPKSGTPYLPGENGGILRPGGQFEKPRLDLQTKVADDRRVLQQYKTKLARAEREAKDAESDWNTAKAALERVRKFEHSDDEGELAKFRELQADAQRAKDALAAKRAARNAIADAEPGSEDTSNTPDERSAPAAPTKKLRWDGTKLVPQ